MRFSTYYIKIIFWFEKIEKIIAARLFPIKEISHLFQKSLIEIKFTDFMKNLFLLKILEKFTILKWENHKKAYDCMNEF